MLLIDMHYVITLAGCRSSLRYYPNCTAEMEVSTCILAGKLADELSYKRKKY